MFNTLNIQSASTLNTESFSVLTMKTLSERLQWAIDHAGIKKIDLARECGISRGAVTQWFNGSTKSLEGANLTNAAKATGVSAHWLATGSGSRVPVTKQDIINQLRFARGERKERIDLVSYPNVVDLVDANMEVPLISWVQAGLFCNAPDLYPPGDGEVRIPCPKKVGPNTYALRVKGDSMVSGNSGEKSYPEGCIIYVDPDKEITNGCRVVARIHANEEATFKKYSEDAGKRYLRPLNKDYEPIIMTEEMHICGVVVGSWMDE
jgi:SOS-response transcriptional repressor LexA